MIGVVKYVFVVNSIVRVNKVGLVLSCFVVFMVMGVKRMVVVLLDSILVSVVMKMKSVDISMMGLSGVKIVIMLLVSKLVLLVFCSVVFSVKVDLISR